MALVKHSRSINTVNVHLNADKEVQVCDFPAPVGLRLSSWYTPAAGEDPFGREGGKPGFLITPLAPHNSIDGAVMNTITNLPAQAFFINAGMLWVPFACKVTYCWPDIDEGRNLGVANFEAQTSEGPAMGAFSAWGACYAHYLMEGQTVNIRREVQSVSCPYFFAAPALDGISTIPFGEWPTPIGGARQLTMHFAGGGVPVVTRVPVKFYY